MYSCHICCVFYMAFFSLVSSHGGLDNVSINPKFSPQQTLPQTNSKGGITSEKPGPEKTNVSESLHGNADVKEHTLDITMDRVHPRTEDAYICTSYHMTNEIKYITNFEALATANRAHHLLIYGCEEPFSTVTWECNIICKRNEEPKILYAWARNAPPTKMPADVGFKVGGDSGVKSLVLQIHYKLPLSPSLPGDTSGIRLRLTTEKQKYIAGILLLMRYDLNIPPGKKVVHGDVSCTYKETSPMYPFGYRVHAHELSSVISAYHHNGNWSLLGKGNPKWPEAFYPMLEQHEIKTGDKLFARCTYDSTPRDTPTYIGGRHTDEMCNFYMMYYMDSEKGVPYLLCSSNEFPVMSQNLPAGNDIPPPSNPDLEEQAEREPKGVEIAVGWPAVSPEDKLTLGQIGGVGTDSHGNVYIFHRGSRRWEANAFDKMNRMDKSLGPIKENTIVVINPQGKVTKQFGSDFFYMPHGMHIDHQDNLWLTDVGLHQVFRINSSSTRPDLVLGTRLQPGSDDEHFCKPTDVAVLPSGEFYVSDGYCNQRVIKYSMDGKKIKEWGSPSKGVEDDGFPPPNTFVIPHSLALIESLGWLCVADRENGRIQVFTLDGEFVKQIHPKEFSNRLFAVAYSPISELLYAVNGPDIYNKDVKVQGFTIHPKTGSLLETWSPPEGFSNPHDLEISPQGEFIYVGELDPQKVWRFYIHMEILEAQKRLKGFLPHPASVDGGKTSIDIGDGEEKDLRASMVIGALLVVPVLFIVGITIFLRLRKNGRFAFISKMMYRKNRNRRFNLGTLLSQKKGFSRLGTESATEQELDHLNSDSDVEEYSATTRKA